MAFVLPFLLVGIAGLPQIGQTGPFLLNESSANGLYGSIQIFTNDNTKVIFFADNLRFLRKKAGKTQHEVGEELGINFKSLGQWETGLVTPRKLEVFEELANYYGVGLGDLLSKDIKAEVSPRPGP